MLARLAENLFWTGRYLERAEDTARMADVTYHNLLESPPDEALPAWEQLLDVLHLRAAYVAHVGEVEPLAVMRFLVTDEANPSAVMASVTRARENLRSVRELVSSELWECSNELYLGLLARDLDAELADQPYDLFATVKRGSQTITGVATETMPRDDGWRFLTVGRMLERAEMTCRMLNVRFGGMVEPGEEMSFHHWVAILKSVSAFEAFRRRYRLSMDPSDVVEFLLLSRTFPRSVLFCLQAAEHQLERLGPGTHAGRARRRLGRIRAEVEYRNVEELLDEGLHDFLDRVQHGVAAVAEGVADEYFRHAAGDLHAVAAN